MSLSTAFNIISSSFAANAAQTAVVSNNISNVNTTGYSREIANVVTNAYGGADVVSVTGCELSTQDEKIRQKAQEMFNRFSLYIETALRDAHREGLIEKCDFAVKSRTIFSFAMGMLLQAKVKNDPEVLQELAPAVMQMIGAAVPA